MAVVGGKKAEKRAGNIFKIKILTNQNASIRCSTYCKSIWPALESVHFQSIHFRCIHFHSVFIRLHLIHIQSIHLYVHPA